MNSHSYSIHILCLSINLCVCVGLRDYASLLQSEQK